MSRAARSLSHLRTRGKFKQGERDAATTATEGHDLRTGVKGHERMRPYYQDESATIYHADCREALPVLADKSVDHSFNDPPYSEHVHGKSRRGSSLPDANDFPACISRARELGCASITPELMRFASEQYARIVRRWTLVFSDVESCHLWREELTRAGLDYARTGQWRKLGGPPQFSGDRPAADFETITICHPPGRKRWNGGGSHCTWDFPIVLNRGGRDPRLHTTQKPLALMRKLVTLFTDPGETVLDSFMGSGTTGEACVLEGRKFVGIEAREEDCERAKARILRARGIPYDKPKSIRRQIETPLFKSSPTETESTVCAP